MNNLKEEFIRDITSATHMPKSEARRRLEEILVEQREKIEKIIQNEIATQMVVANQSGEKTSRLTALAVKLSELTKQ